MTPKRARTPKPTVMRTITRDEWEAQGTALFGSDKRAWRFVCPCCAHVASVADYLAANAHSMIAFSCIGRAVGAKREAFDKGEGPCNYAGGGLIGMNPVAIDGERYFEFDGATS